MNSRNKTFKSVVAMVSLTAIVGMSPLNVLATIEDETKADQTLTVGCSESFNKNDNQLGSVYKEIVKKWGDIEVEDDIFSKFLSKGDQAYSVAKEKFKIIKSELEKSKIDSPDLQDHMNKIEEASTVEHNLYCEREIYGKAKGSLADFLPVYKKYYKDMDETKKLKILSQSDFNRYHYIALINSIESQIDMMQESINEMKVCELQLDRISALEKDLNQIRKLLQSDEYSALIKSLKKEFDNQEFKRLKDRSDSDYKVELKMVECIFKYQELFQAIQQDIASCRLPECLEKCGQVTNNHTLNNYQEELEFITQASDIDEIILVKLGDYNKSMKESEVNITKEVEALSNKIEELANCNSCNGIAN